VLHDTAVRCLPRRIDRALVEDLLAMGFVEHHENVLLRGPSGVGKTMLARCLGLAALAQGRTVRFSSNSDATGMPELNGNQDPLWFDATPTPRTDARRIALPQSPIDAGVKFRRILTAVRARGRPAVSAKAA
jgi:IstB-like ATP binding protein